MQQKQKVVSAAVLVFDSVNQDQLVLFIDFSVRMRWIFLNQNWRTYEENQILFLVAVKTKANMTPLDLSLTLPWIHGQWSAVFC